MWDLTVSADHDFYVVAGGGALVVHNCPMVGEGGTQTFSQTALKDTNGRGFHIDVENPSPGVRAGQMHLQTEIEQVSL